MLQAVKTLRPALDDFYASLDDDQKARFNTMGCLGAKRRRATDPADRSYLIWTNEQLALSSITLLPSTRLTPEIMVP